MNTESKWMIVHGQFFFFSGGGGGGLFFFLSSSFGGRKGLSFLYTVIISWLVDKHRLLSHSKYLSRSNTLYCSFVCLQCFYKVEFLYSLFIIFKYYYCSLFRFIGCRCHVCKMYSCTSYGGVNGGIWCWEWHQAISWGIFTLSSWSQLPSRPSLF